MSNDCAYEPKNAWDQYAGGENRAKIRAFADKYISFISRCKTERETIADVGKILAEAGFGESWQGDKVMVPLRGKAIFAAVRGRVNPADLALIASHADSPRLDLKQRPIVEQAGIVQAKTHYYGGIRRYQWLARPLALHGVVIANGKKIDVRIGENPDEPVLTIADLLPHLAKKQGEQKLVDAFDGEKLNLVIGHEPYSAEPEDKEKERARKNLLNLLRQKYDFTEEDLITAELEAVPAGPARYVGIDESMIGGYGQDDRICVYCALSALLESGATPHTIAVMFWDKEEIGSEGASGASSRFLQYCVEDLARAWAPQSTPSHILLNARAISADVTAALDPDYQDVHEKQNAALLGYGPVFSKYTGSGGKYGASDADAEFYSQLRAICKAANVPWQAAELGKVGLGGGGTVALFLAAYGMRVIDFGPALLSMHSPFELASTVDLYATKEAYRVFYEKS